MNSLLKFLSKPNQSEAKSQLLICLHHGGGGASLFNNWYNALSHLVDIAVVQLPGREDRVDEAFYTDISEVADDLVNDIKCSGYQSITFFGYCMGGLIAYKVCQEIFSRKIPLKISALVIGAAAEPAYCEKYQLNAPLADEKVRQILSQRFMSRYNTACDDEYLDLLLPILKADRAITMSYKDKPGFQFDIPICIAGGADDEGVPIDALNAWKVHTSHDFCLELFTGGHMFIESSEQALINYLERILRNYRA